MFGRFPVTPTVAASTATKTTNATHLRRCHTARARSRPETAYPAFAFCIISDSLGLRRITGGGPVPRPRKSGRDDPRAVHLDGDAAPEQLRRGYLTDCRV